LPSLLFGALDQFLDKSDYCITTVARRAAHFRPGAGVEIDPTRTFSPPTPS
jgi:hypothetical protein